MVKEVEEGEVWGGQRSYVIPERRNKLVIIGTELYHLEIRADKV